MAKRKRNLEVKARLYELEEQLARKRFARFSKSILANLEHVKVLKCLLVVVCVLTFLME